MIDDGQQIGEDHLVALHWILGLVRGLLAAHYLCDGHEQIRSPVEHWSHLCRVLGPDGDTVRVADMAMVLGKELASG